MAINAHPCTVSPTAKQLTAIVSRISVAVVSSIVCCMRSLPFVWYNSLESEVKNSFMRKFEKDLKHLHLIDKKVDDLTLFETDLSSEELLYLEAKGLVNTKFYHDHNYAIEFTNAGLTYFDDRNDAKKQFILKSILTPAFVAFITTLITTYFVPWLVTLFSE